MVYTADFLLGAPHNHFLPLSHLRRGWYSSGCAITVKKTINLRKVRERLSCGTNHKLPIVMKNKRIEPHLIIETPEGVIIKYIPADPFVRLQAYLIDIVLNWVIIVTCAVFIGSIISGTEGKGLGVLGFNLLLIFLLFWFYPVFFEVFFDGRTPGKMILKLKVIKIDGSPIDFRTSFTRNLLRVADFLPTSYCAGGVAMLVSQYSRRIGDLVAGSCVVYQQQAQLPEIKGISEALICSEELSVEEQQAIIEFAERSDQISPERCEELAQIISALYPHSSDSPPLALKKIAYGLLGKR